MLYAFWAYGVPLARLDCGGLTGYRIAAAVLDRVRATDAALSARLHSAASWPMGRKPYTFSPAEQLADGRIRFRVTLLRDGLLGPILEALSADAGVLQINGQPLQFIGADMVAGGSARTGFADARDLVAEAPSDRGGRLFVATPAAFRNTSGARDEIVPGPHASLLVGSLESSWKAYGATGTDPAAVQRLRSRLSLTESEVRRETVQVKDRAVPGFIGMLQLEAPDDAAARVMHTLLALAFFTGIGINTASGMGQALPLVGSVAAPDSERRDSLA